MMCVCVRGAIKRAEMEMCGRRFCSSVCKGERQWLIKKKIMINYLKCWVWGGVGNGYLAGMLAEFNDPL